MRACMNELIWPSPFTKTRGGRGLDQAAQLVGLGPAKSRASGNVSWVNDADRTLWGSPSLWGSLRSPPDQVVLAGVERTMQHLAFAGMGHLSKPLPEPVTSLTTASADDANGVPSCSQPARSPHLHRALRQACGPQ